MAVLDLLKSDVNSGIVPPNFVKFNAKVGTFTLRSKGSEQDLGDAIEFLYVDRASQYKRIFKDKSGKKVVEFSTICKDPRKCTTKSGALSKEEKGYKFVALVYGILLDSEGPIEAVLELSGSAFATFNEAKPKKGLVLQLSKGQLVDDMVSYYKLTINTRELSSDEDNDQVIEKVVESILNRLSTITE